MNLLENKHINNESWRFFQDKLKELAKDQRWLSLMKSTKIKCETFNLNKKWQDRISVIEEELKEQMKIHFQFYNNDYKGIEDTFNVLPLFIQYLILVYFEYFTLTVITYTQEEKNDFLRDISETKKMIAKRCFHFCQGYRDTPIPVNKLIQLIDFNCFNLENKKDKFILDFFNMYLNNKEVKKQMLEELNENYYNYIISKFFSSKTFLDLYSLNKMGTASFVTADLFFNKPKTQPESTPTEKEKEPVEESKAKLITG